MANSNTVIELINVSKFYGKSRGVEGINLTVQRGEVFGFLGPNGAGKTTTIRTMLDFIRPTSGQVKLFGLDSVEDSVAIKKRIGYLAGDLAIYGNMTGKQLVTFLGSLDGKIDQNYLGKLVQDFQIDLHRPLKKLSKGNRQKVGLLQAFVHKPELLILDEPTSGLDPLMQEQFYKLLHSVKQQGTTVLVSSHNLSEVQRVCDRAAFVREGKLIGIEDIGKTKRPELHRFLVTFDKPVAGKDFGNVRGVKVVHTDGPYARFEVAGSVDAFIKALAKHNVQSITPEETALEEIFMRYYEQETT